MDVKLIYIIIIGLIVLANAYYLGWLEKIYFAIFYYIIGMIGICLFFYGLISISGDDSYGSLIAMLLGSSLVFAVYSLFKD
tara:strand:- start:86 stop:328 length:243 start_codon:yes stop_codon:yes gene_type:complete